MKINKVRFKIEYAIYCARQHVEIAKQCIETGMDDLVDYSIRAAEKQVAVAEKNLALFQPDTSVVAYRPWLM